MFELKKMFTIGLFLLSVLFAAPAFGQETTNPSPSPTPKKRTTGVKITKNVSPKANRDSKNESNPNTEKVETKSDTKTNQNPQPDTETLRREQAERLSAGEAALERERQKAAAEAEAKMQAEIAERERAMQEKLDAERRQKEIDLEAERQKSEQKLAEERARQEEELQAERERAEEERKRLEQEAQTSQRQAEEAQRLAEEERKKAEAAALEAQRKAEAERVERERLEKEKAAAEQAAIEAKKQAEAEQERLAQERLAQEKEAAEKLAEEQQNKARLRNDLILSAASELKYLTPALAVQYVKAESQTREEILADLQLAAKSNPRLVKKVSFCDGDFVGEPLNLMLSADPTFGSLLNELSVTFDVNFLPDPEILDLPVAGNVKNVPWNYVLRSQLNYLDLEARCEGNTIAIMKRAKLQAMVENQRKNAPLITEFIRLRYLQPVVGGQVNVAGRGSGGASTLESLEAAINKILRADGDNRGSISRIPGKNEFIITATAEQLTQIRQVIARADRPAYQVVVYAAVVTANENKLRDIGGNLSLIAGTGNLNQLGGINNFPNNSQSSSNGGGNNTNSDSNTNGGGTLNPGGVRTLGSGFGNSPNGGAMFGLSSIFGTVQFSAQLNLLQQQGVVKIDNRPSVIVIDGQTADLQIGRQVAIPIQSINNFGSGGGGQLEVLNAGNTLNVTPQVIEDENGNPVAVNLALRIESNDVDTTVVSQGVPSVIRRSTQTSLMLNTSQTAVIGGFTTDSETNSVSKAPGLGNVPVIGNLFKRKVRAKNSDRLYFAIRVEVVRQGEVLTTLPLNVDTTPQRPNPNNNFFRPYNQEPEKKDQ